MVFSQSDLTPLLLKIDGNAKLGTKFGCQGIFSCFLGGRSDAYHPASRIDWVATVLPLAAELRSASDLAPSPILLSACCVYFIEICLVDAAAGNLEIAFRIFFKIGLIHCSFFPLKKWSISVGKRFSAFRRNCWTFSISFHMFPICLVHYLCCHNSILGSPLFTTGCKF